MAIIAIFEGKLENILYYILIAGILDFADGFAARMLNATSSIGKDLDSLADMVTFGVVPALLFYAILKQNASNDLIPYTALLIAVFSGLRLAKFNNDDRQTDSFYGLPTPANALLLSSYPMLLQSELSLNWLSNEIVLITVIIISSVLLVSDYKLLALKFKNFNIRDNEVRYLLIIVSLLLLIYFGLMSIPLIIIWYLILSVVSNIISNT